MLQKELNSLLNFIPYSAPEYRGMGEEGWYRLGDIVQRILINAKPVSLKTLNRRNKRYCLF